MTNAFVSVLRRFLLVGGQVGLIVGLLSGCRVFTGRPTTLVGMSRSYALNTTPTKPLRLFIDRDGSLYPPDDVFISEEELRDQYEGYLLENLAKGHPHTLRKFYALHGIDTTAAAITSAPAEGWPAFQAALRREAAAAINARLAAVGPQATLVVLIHGFNNTAGEAEASYDAVAARMRREGLPRGPHQLLEVYWDGRRGAAPYFFRYSQPNAQFAGLALRGVLNQLAPQYPVRIITHSLGTLVGCNALWNVTTSMGGKQVVSAADSNLSFWQMLTEPAGNGKQTSRFFYQQACHDNANYRTPTTPDLRLGSIAAATPGATYTDYTDRTPLLTDPKSSIYRRVVITYNPTDKVLNKFWLLAPLNWYLGYTQLGRSNSAYGFVADAVNTRSHDGHSYQIPFYGCREKGKFNHGLIGYSNSAQMPYFLETLLGDTSPQVLSPCPR
ncbi:hypothetical protein ACFP2F_11785 [Hymenobacter artigasi]|uniref:Alpha/beta hydrolase n=1 Tax=Hymenobacter artigasi TaxID=2719616 RepID=A0ABX1HGV8_9BACT|nr:hypothetical protein [Hymenobacter artigasi]NKI89493.1 hypothetical protein [Hymenobacter artigasi]